MVNKRSVSANSSKFKKCNKIVCNLDCNIVNPVHNDKMFGNDIILSFYFTFIQYALFNVKNDNINEKNLLLNQLANIINGLCYDKEENKINFIDDKNNLILFIDNIYNKFRTNNVNKDFILSMCDNLFLKIKDFAKEKILKKNDLNK